MRALMQNRVAAVSTGALVLAAVGAGGAVAGSKIGSREIRDDSVRSVDLRDNTVRSVDLRNRGVRGADLAVGSVKKRHIAPDSVGLSELNKRAIEALSDDVPTSPTRLTVGDLGPFVAASSSCGAGTPTGSQRPVNSTTATPPLGAGSYQLAVGPDGDSLTSLAVNEPGTTLAALRLRYSTFVDEPSASQGQAPYLIVDIDNDGDGQRDDQIFFEPTYQDGSFAGDVDQGDVAVGEWQTWNATLGGSTWWRFDAQSQVEYTTLSAYRAGNMDAQITRLRVSVGCGGAPWAGFVGNVDSIELNGAVFDFERY